MQFTQNSSGSESGNSIAGSVADINKHGHFPRQKLNLADIRALNPTEELQKPHFVLLVSLWSPFPSPCSLKDAAE